MFEVIGGILFWTGLLGLLHTYIFYPLSLLLLARKSPPPPDDPVEWPSVSILIPAYNEETHIGAKIENCLALDYPAEKLEVLVGSDCSTDRTAEIAKSHANSRIRFFEMEQRAGKVGVLNRLAKEARGEIFVFTDANAFIDTVAVRKLVRHFGNPSVGAVSGHTSMVAPSGIQEVRGEGLYRKYENLLKTLESNLGGTTGTYGPLYAIRGELFTPFHLDGRHDDMFQLLRTVEQGKRVIFEPAALAFEETGASIGEEFHRRVRIGIGNFQTLAKMGYMIHPRYGATAYTFFSHKILRWISPFLMLAMLIGSLALLHIFFYRAVLCLQVLWYAIAALGGLLNRCGIHLPGIILFYHFTILNIAFLLGFFNWLGGARQVIWRRTERKPLA